MAAQEKEQWKIHIAIDFGTDGLGLAYAIKDEVYIHQRWNCRRYGTTVKPKMILLLDDEEKAYFGMDAKHTLIFVYINDRE